MTRNEERRNERAEVRHRNLLVIPTEIGDGRQVRRQKLQDIGKDFASNFYIYLFFCIRYIQCLLILIIQIDIIIIQYRDIL